MSDRSWQDIGEEIVNQCPRCQMTMMPAMTLAEYRRERQPEKALRARIRELEAELDGTRHTLSKVVTRERQRTRENARLRAALARLEHLLVNADPNDPAWLEAKAAALSHQGEPTAHDRDDYALLEEYAYNCEATICGEWHVDKWPECDEEHGQFAVVSGAIDRIRKREQRLQETVAALSHQGEPTDRKEP